jgi:hypothetical protein
MAVLTNLQALSGATNYPVSDIHLNKILIDREINGWENYTGMTRAFELATADLYVLIATSASISEGGFEVSVSEKASILALAKAIYAKYGINQTTPSMPNIRNRSNLW